MGRCIYVNLLVGCCTITAAVSIKRFTNKVVLILGGTSGIGRAAALQFSAEGALVMIGGRNIENGARVVEEIRLAGSDGDFLQTDVCSPEQVEAVVARTVERLSLIHI